MEIETEAVTSHTGRNKFHLFEVAGTKTNKKEVSFGRGIVSDFVSAKLSSFCSRKKKKFSSSCRI